MPFQYADRFQASGPVSRPALRGTLQGFLKPRHPSLKPGGLDGSLRFECSGRGLMDERIGSHLSSRSPFPRWWVLLWKYWCFGANKRGDLSLKRRSQEVEMLARDSLSYGLKNPGSSRLQRKYSGAHSEGKDFSMCDFGVESTKTLCRLLNRSVDGGIENR